MLAFVMQYFCCSFESVLLFERLVFVLFLLKNVEICKFSHGYDVILISNYVNLSKIEFIEKKILLPFRKCIHVYSFRGTLLVFEVFYETRIFS